MHNESMKELLGHVKLQKEIPETMFSIARILENEKMKDYRNVCFNRIADALYIDGKHVILDLTDKEMDIAADKIGLAKCKDVLLGYISEKSYNYYEELIFLLSRSVHDKNNMLRTLRRMSRKELREGMKEGISSKDPDTKEMGMLFGAELKARKNGNKSMNAAKEKTCDIYTRLKYHKIIEFTKKTIKENRKQEEGSRYSARGKRDWIAYYEALERFLGKHGEDFKPEELDEEELLKYIHLTVNTSTRAHSVKGDVLALEEMERCSDAIGLLTAEELQQLFPIEKEYDGAKHEQKDYFYTTENIRKYKQDIRIKDRGRGVSDFLWDYYNHRLSIFTIDYFNQLEDLYVAKGHKSIFEEVFSKESTPLPEAIQEQEEYSTH